MLRVQAELDVHQGFLGLKPVLLADFSVVSDLGHAVAEGLMLLPGFSSCPHGDELKLAHGSTVRD